MLILTPLPHPPVCTMVTLRSDGDAKLCKWQSWKSDDENSEGGGGCHGTMRRNHSRTPPAFPEAVSPPEGPDPRHGDIQVEFSPESQGVSQLRSNVYATTFQETLSMSRLNEGIPFPDRRLVRLSMALSMALGSAGTVPGRSRGIRSFLERGQWTQLWRGTVLRGASKPPCACHSVRE